MATKRARKPKGPTIVDLEFATPAEFRQFKVWAVQLPERYGINLGEKGWQLPEKQDRFLEVLALLHGKILPYQGPNW
jgi:hypothetical protein